MDHTNVLARRRKTLSSNSACADIKRHQEGELFQISLLRWDSLDPLSCLLDSVIAVAPAGHKFNDCALGSALLLR